jgi:hypothetical protein
MTQSGHQNPLRRTLEVAARLSLGLVRLVQKPVGPEVLSP